MAASDSELSEPHNLSAVDFIVAVDRVNAARHTTPFLRSTPIVINVYYDLLIQTANNNCV